MKRLIFCLLCFWSAQDVQAQSDTLYTQFFKYWEAYDWENAIATGETWKSTANVGNAPRDSFAYGYFSSKLGRAYLLVGNFDKAALNYGEAFKYVSPDSMHYAVMYTELAQLNMMWGRLIDGEAQAGKAVEWYRQHGFTHSDKYPNAVRILGDLLYMQGLAVLAERQFQTALQLWLSNGFPPSKILGTIYDDLGLCYDQQNRLLQAEYYFLKADTLFRQFLKPNDPIRYTVKKQLAELYINKGAWGTARRLIQELGEQATAQFGVHSDQYAQYLGVKAQMFEAIGEGNNTRDAIEAQCAIYQNLYGGRHHQTINAQISLGLTLVNLHEEELAKDIALRVLDSIDASGEAYLNLKISVYGLLASCSDHDTKWRKKALAAESEIGSPKAETVAMLAVDYLWQNLPDSAAQVLTILDTLEQYVP
ncbi:MAG: tetratricopeptide repeat protein, partial [Bacteroidota bacterium]